MKNLAEMVKNVFLDPWRLALPTYSQNFSFVSLSDEFQVAKVHPSRGYRGKQVMSRTCAVRYSALSARNLVPRVRIALSSGTGNGDLWDNPFQLEFSLVDHLSMSSRTRSQKVNKNGGKDSTERVFKLLLSVVNQIFCSWTPIWGLAKPWKEGEFAYSA